MIIAERTNNFETGTQIDRREKMASDRMMEHVNQNLRNAMCPVRHEISPICQFVWNLVERLFLTYPVGGDESKKN